MYDVGDLARYRFYRKYIVYKPRLDGRERHVPVVCGSRVLGDYYASEFVHSGQCCSSIAIRYRRESPLCRGDSRIVRVNSGIW